jgi:hypothetical protein
LPSCFRDGTAGNAADMRKVIRKQVRHTGEGIDLAADLNAAISVNRGGGQQVTHVSSRQEATVSQGTATERDADTDRRSRPSDETPKEGR